MKTRSCNFCRIKIDNNDGISIQNYDLCRLCTQLVRRAICPKCEGTGKVRRVDHEATYAQATCGENRTQYRTVPCKACE